MSTTLRERAASQPPRTSENTFLHSPTIQSAFGGSPWPNQNVANLPRGISQPIPTRSSSFSANQQSQFSSAMRERSFSSTFEDDELEGLSDTYDDRYLPSISPNVRGRTYASDMSRSRSQSLANTRAPGTIGNSYVGSPPLTNWNDSFSSIPGSRYGDIKPPGSSRYGSLGAMGRTNSNMLSSSPSAAFSGYSNRQGDISNMSPFVRDVVLDEGSAFREIWAGMNENGGGSGATSRRHSVSVVQPRRGTIVGFNAPGTEDGEESSMLGANYGRGGLLLSDEDLAADLGGRLNLSANEGAQQSLPSSLPIYAPLSRSPPSNDLMASYHPMNLTIPTGTSFSRQSLHSPSDSGVSNGSPGPSQYEQSEAQFRQSQQSQTSQREPELTARFIPGQGIQYLPPLNTSNLGNNNGTNYVRNRAPSYSGGVTSPLSPNTRAISQPQQQQQPFYLQRRPSETPQPLNELGKGVPLHAVPASWPLYIVEFKAGRTDLFYLTDLSQDIREGDLVIVEADRGKDLGKVINDSITLAEVEAFQKQQAARASFGSGGPNSPGGAASSPVNAKKEINPKMIYGKAQPQDTQ